jgi:hypothetical protein
VANSERPNAAYLTGSVFRGELPILLVLHNGNGDWQFLDGGAVSRDDSHAVHIGHVFDEHPDVQALRDLPPGWAAERPSEAAEWARYPWPEDAE